MLYKDNHKMLYAIQSSYYFFTLDAKNGKKHNFLAEMKTIMS